jgi:hypothetical protein
MGTRSRIGIVNSDGSIESIYCHWDGYLDHNGMILLDHYTDEAKIRELMKLGNISTLGKIVGKKHPFDLDHLPNGYDIWKKRWGHMCNAYGRDRGEDDNASILCKNLEEFNDLSEEYNYLWENGRWVVSCYSTNGNFVEVHKDLTVA